MSYSEDDKRRIWERRKGPKTDKTGRDRYGFKIHWDKYGEEPDNYAWEVDHNMPKKAGGPHKIDNWQPLHWITNELKADKVKSGEAKSDNPLTLADLVSHLKPDKDEADTPPMPKVLLDSDKVKPNQGNSDDPIPLEDLFTDFELDKIKSDKGKPDKTLTPTYEQLIEAMVQLIRENKDDK